jgi:16S rRNA (adenine1518-N6/adenine1519-N6)-dimethyltransferase
MSVDSGAGRTGGPPRPARSSPGGSPPDLAPGARGDEHPLAAPASSGLRQVSLARLKEFGVSPKHGLGQNFLIDDNILGVILSLLECRPDDVVLEVGAGLGVLTAALAREARCVHAFEVDRSLEPALAATLEDGPKVALRFEDVLKAPLEGLDPTPTLCASNLPYSIAGPFIVESLRRLPGVRRYCVMVQREVAERMAAAPGSKAYGVLSVWVQLYATIARLRPLSRSIFYPRPRVDSSLVVLDRLPADRLPTIEPSRLGVVIQAAFAQRRKTLANALSAGLGVPREEAQAMIAALGLPLDVRAEKLEPRRFVELAANSRFGRLVMPLV